MTMKSPRVTAAVSIAAATRELIDALGEPLDRPGLRETPDRVAKAWGHWTRGYWQDPALILKTFKDGANGVDEMVFMGKIPFYSHCEHHLAPFFGLAHVAYIPSGEIVGLSKLPRLVEMYAQRLQVQERLCNQVADAMFDGLKPRGVGVVMQARHLCMESRGISRPGVITVTAAVRGNFKDRPEVRAEFMGFVQQAMSGISTL